jgi:hypothetical protein
MKEMVSSEIFKLDLIKKIEKFNEFIPKFKYLFYN